MLTVAAASWLNAVSAIAVIGAAVAGYAAIRKLGPEKDALFITTAQGAATIQDNLIKTLYTEIDRERAVNQSLAIEVERLTAENAKLLSANLALKRRHGTRDGDPD